MYTKETKKKCMRVACFSGFAFSLPVVRERRKKEKPPARPRIRGEAQNMWRSAWGLPSLWADQRLDLVPVHLSLKRLLSPLYGDASSCMCVHEEREGSKRHVYGFDCLSNPPPLFDFSRRVPVRIGGSTASIARRPAFLSVCSLRKESLRVSALLSRSSLFGQVSRFLEFVAGGCPSAVTFKSSSSFSVCSFPSPLVVCAVLKVVKLLLLLIFSVAGVSRLRGIERLLSVLLSSSSWPASAA